MGELSRIGIAIDSELLAQFDLLLGQQGYTNRSEAFRDLIRERLIRQKAQQPGEEVVGTLTLVYDHHVRLLPEKLTEMQHAHHHAIISSLHVHLDHDNCLEVLVVRGRSNDVQQLANLLIATKGVKHGQLTVTTPHVHQPEREAHEHPHQHARRISKTPSSHR